ncbi:MAG: glycosyltransferase [Acetobacteraceae bacterium]|nr:glycosyltransferase [Acetobacteraceae bacterium]
MQDRLTVLLVAFPFATVGPDAVGGAEQVVSALDGALADAGHRSLVVACGGSSIRGTHIAIETPPAGVRLDDAARAAVHQRMREAIGRVLERKRVDLVHLHGVDFGAYLPPHGPPALATLHLPVAWYPPEALRPGRERFFLHCVSEAQHRTAPAGPGLLPPIPNGVPVEDLAAARHARRSFLLTLGRICPEKGQHIALEIAHAAGLPLLIGGAVFPYPAHQDYFATRVRPLLDARRRFLGPVGHARKRRLLAAARCVLIPSLAAETSSLVAMEAAAAGTPAIAFAAGALPETVEHGRTGFVVDGPDAMADAVRRAGTIDPETCRATARARFDRATMTRRYLALYRRLAAA